VRRADPPRPEACRGRPPGLPGPESTGGREGDPSFLRGAAEGGARAGDGGHRAHGVHLDVGRTERGGFVGAFEVAAGSDRRGEGGRLPPGTGPGRGRGRVATIQGLKVDVDEMNDLVRRARKALGVQNYHEGLRLLNEANDHANKAAGMHKQAYNAIATAAAFVADAKKRNVDVSKV